MLKGIPKILSPDLLHTLRAMGHGDMIVIGDANFPAESMAQRCLRLDGLSATEVLDAILTLFPLDTFVENPAHVMQVVGDPDAIPEIVREFQGIVDRHADVKTTIAGVERFAFYDMARQAFAIVQTGEDRLYGNIILTKGVIGS